MNEIDERAQQEAEEQRMMETLAVLQRVRNTVNLLANLAHAGENYTHVVTSRDIQFLAAELGLSSQYKEMK